MKNGRRSKLSASAASYNKRQPRHCSRSASRRLARGCTQRKPKRKPSTKTKNQNENRSRCSLLVLVFVCGFRLWFSFWFGVGVGGEGDTEQAGASGSNRSILAAMNELRETNLGKLERVEFDVLVLGGGINGAVSAASLSARGARVALIDRGDFAGFTSQQSSNLAWGGIKYMESYELGLVRKLCR